MKQRQPMLDAGGAAALAHRLVEHVVRTGRAERRDIAGAKLPDRFRVKLELRHGNELEPAQLVGGALGFRIEAADRFQRVAEEIEADGRVHSGREQIDDAAAHRIVARLAHGGGAGEAVELEPLRHARHRQQRAGGGGQRLRRHDLPRHHALQHGIDRRQHDGRPVVVLGAREPRQRRHALRHDVRMRRHPVVGQAVPGGEFDRLDVRREKAERARQHSHARAVAADCGETDRRRRGAGRPRGNGARQIGERQPFGAIGDAGEQKRPAGIQTPRQRRRGRSQLRSHRSSWARILVACQ